MGVFGLIDVAWDKILCTNMRCENTKPLSILVTLYFLFFFPPPPPSPPPTHAPPSSDQPRKPGNRLESPATLGRKCWAFAYLAQLWDPGALRNATKAAGLNTTAFSKAYTDAIPFTMALCRKVLGSCFVNATPTPATCPGQSLEFEAGFYRENIKRADIVHYPFAPPN